MTGSGAEQPQRYCTHCGAEIRLGNAFCVSCGASLRLADTGPKPSGRSGRPASDSGRVLRYATDGIRETFSRLRAENLRSVPSRARRWFGGLPIAVKATLAVLVLLALFTVLSPLGAVVAAVVFAVSMIALIIRVAQRRSVMGWGTTAVASLALALAFSGVSSVLYGGGLTTGTEQGPSSDTGYATLGDGGGSPHVGNGASGDNSAEDGNQNPVDVYLVTNDSFFLDGYLLVNRTSKGRFFHAYGLGYDHYGSGEVYAGGQLYLHGIVGDLDNLDYACTYDADDPNGGKAAMQEACGFSPLEE
jgi:hypothetical protein